jgi:hypothetical protein
LQFAIPKIPAIFFLGRTKGDSVENDLAEIKERQDQLEAYLSALESRVDWQEAMLPLVDAKNGGRTASRPADLQSEDADIGEERPGVQDAEALLRSVVLKQSLHGTTLRRLAASDRRRTP